MSRIRSKDTRPEVVVRSVLHRMGYRFRLHRKDLPGKPDVVLPKHKTVVLIHGCFWHGCERCDRGTRVPKTNTEFWLNKIAENRRRDEEVDTKLAEAGWRVITVWACDTADVEKLQKLFNSSLPRTDAGGRVRRPHGPSSTSSPAAAG